MGPDRFGRLIGCQWLSLFKIPCPDSYSQNKDNSNYNVNKGNNSKIHPNKVNSFSNMCQKK
jgi:hypothetical protein